MTFNNGANQSSFSRL